MGSFWIRKLIGVENYRRLFTLYQKFNYRFVIPVRGNRASQTILSTQGPITIDLRFGAGYGAILNEVLKLLAYERDNNKQFSIRVISRYYSTSQNDCALQRFFDEIEKQTHATPLSPASFKTVTINSINDTPALRAYNIFSGSIETAHELFFSRYRFKDRILKEAQERFHRLTEGKQHLLGLHYRGTDKTNGDSWAEGNPVDASEFVRHAHSIVEKHPEIDGIYVATDEQRFLDFVRREVTTLPVYGEDLKNHATHGLGLHTMPGDPAEKAKDAVMVMLMLSQCRYLLKTTSLLSAWSKVINPDLVAFVPQKPREETGGNVFPDKEVYETAAPIPASVPVRFDSASSQNAL